MAIMLNSASTDRKAFNAWRPMPKAPVRSADGAAHYVSALHQISARVRYARQETIFNEGDNADHAYKVISGAVRLCKHTQDGRRQIADFMLPGDVFGLMELDAHSCTAEAVSDVVLLSYPKAQIERLGETTPGLNKYLISMLSRKLVQTQDHLVVLGRQSAKERVASFLLRLAERGDLDNGERIDLPMGRQDVADHLGLTIETVCRVIAGFKRQGIIANPDVHELQLRNLGALHTIAAGAA